MKCLLLSNDLMFGSQAADAARQAGFTVTHCRDTNSIEPKILDGIHMIIVDLTTPGLDAQSLADRIQSSLKGCPDAEGPKRVAVGPHVHTARLDAARAAGWHVVTRGQFHAHAAEILGADAAR